MATSPWICQTCKKPIAPNEGMIEIVNGNTSLGEVGAFPIEPTPEDPPFSGSIAEKVEEMRLKMVAGPNIVLQVYHQDTCDPNPDNEGYWFETSRAPTLEQWCGWVLHLGPKTWLGKGDILVLLSAWWVNRGLDGPHV